MQRDESAAQANISIDTIGRYETIGLWDAIAPDQLAWLLRNIVLEALGFSIEQIACARQTGVSIAQLRGMLRYRRCVDPGLDEAGLAAQIDRIEELDRIAS